MELSSASLSVKKAYLQRHRAFEQEVVKNMECIELLKKDAEHQLLAQPLSFFEQVCTPTVQSSADLQRTTQTLKHLMQQLTSLQQSFNEPQVKADIQLKINETIEKWNRLLKFTDSRSQVSFVVNDLLNEILN